MKKVMALFLAGVFLFTLIGCGQQKPSEPSDESQQALNTTSSIATTSPVVTTTTDPREAQLQAEYDDIFNSAKSDYDQQNYEQALVEFKKIGSDYWNWIGVQNMIDDTTNQYRNAIIQEADAALTSTGVDAALEIINKGLAMLPDDQTLIDKKSTYDEYLPVDLMSLKPFIDDMSDFEGSYTDSMGNTYDQCIKAFMDGSKTYIINRSYTNFTGVIALASNSIKDSYYAVINVYGDNQLLFSSQKFYKGTRPQNFDINITGIDELKIESKIYYQSWVVSSPQLILGNLELSKKP